MENKGSNATELRYCERQRYEPGVKFYRDVLGLPLKFESPGWTEFATEGATLALHFAGGGQKAGGDSASAGPGRCRPGFGLPNLDEFHQRMLANNVRCVQAPKETFGVRIAQYADPDGLVFSVAEHRDGK